MVIEQEWIGKTGFVERAVNLHGHDSLAIAVGYVDDIKGDIDAEDLTVAPFFDCSGAAELLSHVCYDGVVGEAGKERVGIMFTDCPNESRYRLRYSCFFI